MSSNTITITDDYGDDNANANNNASSSLSLDDYSYYYNCPTTTTVDDEDEATNNNCAVNCTGLAECESCGCAVMPSPDDTGGPWGSVMDVFFCLLPIFFLIIVTVKPNNPWPTTSSLPTAAVIMFLVRVMYLASDPLLCSGCVVLGLHEAWTPLTIMAGAITLFETMESTYCMPYMMREMKVLTKGHAVAETMLIFCFAYMVEGASGFGTPVALGAPMLVSTGHAPFQSVILLLVFNTFATVWGAVGTPIWFGFGNLDLNDPSDFVEISQKSAIGIVFASFILMPWVLTIMIPWKMVRKNIIFVLMTLVVCIGPAAGIAAFNYEFPALVGGLVGFCLTAVLIRCKVGLSHFGDDDDDGDVGDDEEMVPGRKAEDIGSVSEHSIVSKYRRATSSLRSTVEVTDIDSAAATAAAAAASNHSSPSGGAGGVVSGSNTHTKGNSNVIDDDDDVKDRTDANTDEEDDNAGVVIEVDDNNDIIMNNGADGGSIVGGWEHRYNNNSTGTAGSSSGKKVSLSLTNDEETAAIAEQQPQPAAGSSVLEEEDFAVAGSLRETIDEHLGPRKSWKEGYLWEFVWRTFPLWGVVLVLILTRVEQIGIKYYLTLREPYFEILFGTYGDFRLSVSVVFQLLNILTYPNLNWKYEFFYLPFIMPFILISVITMIIFRKDMKSSPWQIVKTVCRRLANPAIALMGALVLVQLMIKEGTAAPSYILGTVLSDWFKQGFVVITPLLGALGSFFSGSTTVSNLTFGRIQKVAAERIGTSVNAMLALQALGATAGNGICLNNIIAACAVVGLSIGEGKIMLKTAKFVFSFTTIATIVMLAFFLRFE